MKTLSLFPPKRKSLSQGSKYNSIAYNQNDNVSAVVFDYVRRMTGRKRRSLFRITGSEMDGLRSEVMIMIEVETRSSKPLCSLSQIATGMNLFVHLPPQRGRKLEALRIPRGHGIYWQRFRTVADFGQPDRITPYRRFSAAWRADGAVKKRPGSAWREALAASKLRFNASGPNPSSSSRSRWLDNRYYLACPEEMWNSLASNRRRSLLL